jgi:stearoyl-CoA desaturase (delta-9 desaturase)
MTEAFAVNRVETREIGLGDRVVTLVFVFGPIPVLGLALYMGWLTFTYVNLTLFLTMYLLSGFGVTAGFHRLFTHRSYETSPPLRAVFAVLGTTAVQGSVLDWSAEHRKHHAYADQPGDPHSPHAEHEGRPILGFMHAHFGWFFSPTRADWEAFIKKDLMQDRALLMIHRWTLRIIIATFFIMPFAVGYVATGFTFRGGMQAFLWGGVLKMFLNNHVTFSINSICHMYGKRPFDTEDFSTNCAWVAGALGEQFHNNHHALPMSARHGFRRWEIDPTWWLIRGMEKIGWVWNVKVYNEEEMQRRRAVLAERAAQAA